MLARRQVLRLAGFATACIVPGFPSHAASVEEVRGGMVDIARYYLRTTDWAPDSAFGLLEKRFYCNIFVADVAREAGGATWDKIARPIGIFPERDPVAKEWADSKFNIRGWKMIFDESMVAAGMSASDIFELRQPGDVVSGPPGHVGIVSDDRTSQSRLTFSAASSGAVVLNDWSFRLPDPNSFLSTGGYEEAAITLASRYAVRRFVGA
jgi:hypothetical protein